MKKFGVIGQPVKHSLSPIIHQAFADQCLVDLEYQKIAAPVNDFAGTAEKFFADGGTGLNVTVPFKIEANRWVTELDALAKEAGAVNTIAKSVAGYKGYNTDGTGLIADLKRQFGVAGRNQRVLILGAGGATQGILGALLREAPRRLVVANRTVARAHRLKELFTQTKPALETHALDAISGEFDFVINATAASMSGEALSIPKAVLSGAVCYDLFYDKEPTPFCATATKCGAARVADGLGMLIEQAAAGFNIWWQQIPETNELHNNLRKRL